MSLITEEMKGRAEVYHGDELCQKKSKELLKEIALPNGLLPLKDMEECGYDRESGFVWLKQKKSSTHKFDKIGKLVSYAPEVTAQVEHGKIKKLSGVKSKEILIWVSLSEIYVDNLVLAMLWRHPENVELDKVKVVHYCAVGSKPWRYTGKEENMDREDIKMLVEKWWNIYEDESLDYDNIINMEGFTMALLEAPGVKFVPAPSAA